jgi:hypothetical protein
MDGLELPSWQRCQLEDQLRHAETARRFRRTQAILEASRGKPVAGGSGVAWRDAAECL